MIDGIPLLCFILPVMAFIAMWRMLRTDYPNEAG